MDLELPEIPFSISEFQQAGLLLEGEGYLNDPIAEMQHAAPADQMLHLHFASGQSSCQPGSSESLSPAEQGPSQRRNNSTQDPQQSRLQPSPAETLGRRRQANREHQRRYREKRKAHSNVVEHQLAGTLAQLQALQLEKEELQVKLLQAESKGKATDEQHCAADAEPEAQPGPWLLPISVKGKEAQMTVEDVINMDSAPYTDLWMSYVNEIRACLASTHDHSNTALQTRLHMLVQEAMLLRDNRLKADINEARFFSEEPPSFFANLLCVLNLSSDQVSDLMLLRHVYITRKVLLDAQRAKLITKMQQSSPDAIAEAMKASNVAQQIGDDAGQRRQLFHRVTWAVYCGVLSSDQAAEVLIRAGAKTCIIPGLLGFIAEKFNYPSIQQIADRADDVSSSPDWSDVFQYIETINPYASVHPGYVSITRQTHSITPTHVTLY